MASAVTEQQLRCSLCHNVFYNPVSIPCGHNYCRGCIKNHWDARTTCECPICEKAFKPRPDLRVNWVLHDITEQFKRSLKDKPTPSNLKPRSMSVGSSTSDLHQDAASAAVKRLSLIDRYSSSDNPQIPEVETRWKKIEKDFEDMIQARMNKAEEIKALVNQCKEDKDNEIQTSTAHITMIRRAVDIHQSGLQEGITQQQEEVESRSDKLLQEIQGEIAELRMKHSQLHRIKDSPDPLRLIQSYKSLTATLSTRDWSCVKLQTDNHIGTARHFFASLAGLCHNLENQLCAEVDVTLDPATAAAWLLLSPDGKKVKTHLGGQGVNVPNDPRRFDSCAAVLGRQSFTSGRHYWIVQVGDKTDWELGVAGESINRRGLITVRPDSGYWAICRRKGGSLIACAGPSFTLQLQENPKKVGVFLDYEKGSVTFYDTEAKTHIHTYSGNSFSEPLYPYFNPCHHDNGKNTAPLIICPVKP
ncbi:zinc-binding protein A33-like isoform X3 [Nelusetta ayraudi]|uniref:zinc-binding protein A33-like isoform X3 n=1 Tax=Nelusetta ayraudi TaxID=303726 RepID=UPI003F6E523A